MASNDSVKTGLALLIGGGTLVFTALKRMSRTRKVQDHARAELVSAPQGLIEVEGHVLPFGRTYWGFRHHDLVYRKIEVQKWVRRNKSSSWETVYEEAQGGHFVLADGTGYARVDLARAEFELSTQEYPYETLRPELKRKFHAEYSLKVNGLPSPDPGGFFSRLFTSSWRVRESCLVVGAPVYVTGTFRSDAIGKGEFELPPRAQAFLDQVKAFRKNPALRRRMLDLNMDGYVCEDEEVMGPVRIYGTSRPRDASAPIQKVPFAGAVMSDSNHQVFVADCHEERLLERIGSWNTLRVIAGAGLIAAGAIVLLNVF